MNGIGRDSSRCIRDKTRRVKSVFSESALEVCEAVRSEGTSITASVTLHLGQGRGSFLRFLIRAFSS